MCGYIRQLGISDQSFRQVSLEINVPNNPSRDVGLKVRGLPCTSFQLFDDGAQDEIPGDLQGA